MTMRVEHLVGLVVSHAASKMIIICVKLHIFKVGWQILSLSGTNPFPLAASVLPESLLPEFLCRAVAIWGSSFLRRLVVSCPEILIALIFLAESTLGFDTVLFFF